jgi:hypothetical protein
MQIAGEIRRGEKVRSLALRAPFDQSHSFIALEEPVNNRKQEAHGESAHQHTCNAFYRTHEAPSPGENKISIADGRITRCRKVERGFPG